MTGHLRLCFDVREGRTFLSEQSFRAPMHISKPYWDGNQLIVNVVNPTAGFFPGDELKVDVEARPGTRTVMTSPSASRIFRGREELSAVVVKQRFLVNAGAQIEIFPEMLIPHAGARFAQETVLDVAEGAELLMLESMAPGRVAMGEAFTFHSLRWMTQLSLGGRLAALERYRLSPDDDSLHSLKAHFPVSYHATGYLVSPKLPKGTEFLKAVAALNGESVLAGASSVGNGAVSFRILAADAISLRRAIAGFRRLAYEVFGLPFSDLRKL
jgi:urease accessory protein